MELFNSYCDEPCFVSFKEAFDVKRLIDSSSHLPDAQKNAKYDRECCVDFSGIAPYMFTEKVGGYLLSVIMDNREEFEKNKVRLHFRFLLVYPYSAHAISRIQAEISRNRAAINEQSVDKKLLAGMKKVETVHKGIFLSSNFVSKQIQFLRSINDFMLKNSISNSTPDRLVIRFTPTAVNVCMYRINDIIYISPYVLAKEWRGDTKCFERTPVIMMTEKSDNKLYSAYKDHFRYLWSLPQSILLEDATDYKCDTHEGDIAVIKSPENIDYNAKARKLKERDRTLRSGEWKKQVKDLLYNLCPAIPEESPDKQRIFISCSWESKPAKKIEEWLKHDIGDVVGVDLVDAKSGTSIKDAVYKNLNLSTVALVFFTCDMYVPIKNQNIKLEKVEKEEKKEDEYFAKPNIYHEFGYLMAMYESRGCRNMIIPLRQVGEKEVYYPSNISDTAYEKFDGDMIEEAYERIIDRLKDLLSLEVSIVCYAFRSHAERLEQLVLMEENTEAREWLRNIKKRVKDKKCRECDKPNCPERTDPYNEGRQKKILL
jgi:hypothetical protein